MLAGTWKPELLWFAAAALLPAWLVLRVFRRRVSSAERAYAWVLACQLAWIALYVVELLVPSLEAKIAIDGLEYVPMVGIAGTSLVFACRYTETPVPWRVVVAFLTLGTLGASIVVTAPWHGLLRESAFIAPMEPFDVLLYQMGLLDYALSVGTYLVAFCALVLLVRNLGRVHPAYFASTVPVLAGLALPFFSTLIGAAIGVTFFGQRDTSFLSFGLAGALVVWGVYQRQAFALVPVARDVVFDRIPDAALLISAEGIVLDVNRAGAELLGIDDANDVVGRSVSRVDDESKGIHLAPLLALESGGRVTLDPRPDGRVFEGRCEFVHGVRAVTLRDVTEQVEARSVLERDWARLRARVVEGSRQLEETERLFRAVFDQTYQLIGVLDRDGILREANITALRLGGVELADVAGRPFWETVWWQHSATSSAEVRAAVERAQRGHFVRFETTHVDAAGRVHHIDFSLKPVLDESGEVTMIIPEGRDITNWRAAEEQLRQAQKMDALGRLAGGVAHDLNNILTVISGSVSIALEETNDAGLRELLGQIEEASESAAGLTKQLLALGRKSMVRAQALDVARLVERALRMLRRVIPESIEVVVDIESEAGAIWFDDGQFQQVLLNLAVNARDAMPSGGRLAIRARKRVGSNIDGLDPTGTFVELVVEDTGMGMSPEDAARIFEPFFTTKAPGKGTGLGLSIVYGAMVQHAGVVFVESSPGVGTSFHLWFRAADADSAGDGLPRPDSGQGARTLVVVEDEAPVRAVLRRVLEGAGHRVRTFASGDEFIERLPQLEQPDLLITDAMMPGASGHEVIEAFHGRFARVPVLLISGYSSDGRLRALIDSGTPFLPKPFPPARLLEEVDSLLRMGSVPAQKRQ